MVPHHSRNIEVSDQSADLKVIGRLLPYLWPSDNAAIKTRIILALIFVVSGKIATVSVPLIYKQAVDGLTIDPANALIAVPILLILSYGAIRLMQIVFTQLQDTFFSCVGERAVRILQVEVVDHLQKLGLQFHLDRQTGALSRTIERGARAIDMLLSMVVLRTMPAILEFIFVCGIMAYLFSWTYAAVTAFSLVAYAWFTLLMTNWRLQFRRDMIASDGDAHSKLVDALINYETVKYFNNENTEISRLDRAFQGYEKAAVRSKVTLSWLNMGQGALINLGGVVVMLMAAFEVKNGTMTIGGFVAINTYMLQLFIPLSFLGTLYRETKQAIVDLENQFALLDREPEVQDKPDAEVLTEVSGDVRFDHVDFSYKSDRQILRDISLQIEPGQRIAIVGPTGSGKSTIVRLLYRFYDVTGGAITVDGKDLRDVTQDSFRRFVGVVPQDTVLFNDTIYYNIAYGNLDASREDVIAAADQAQLTSFIDMLPDGFETDVGERGLKLSGGEKQRVGIARAILKKPKILIFDEATSSLDMVTEKDIQASMRNVAEGRTTLIIAHRLSTITDVDRIFVLKDGILCESGTHQALLERQGIYADLWEAQKREQAPPELVLAP